ncbi:MAG: hypothetical protein GXO79_12620 [Chlorobi bacterium]|nr:hypothetical protein [Chlorobiota bacterium]
MKQKIRVKIADFCIGVFTQDAGTELVLSENYSPFIYTNKNTTDISIEVKTGIPPNFLSTKEIYKAKHEGSSNNSAYFWSIHNLGENKKIVFTSNPGNTQFPYLALVLSAKSKNWQLYFDTNKTIIDPFIYPIGPLIMYYVATFNNACMIHASGVEMNEAGYIFSGVSGIGKSTMAELFHQKGAKIINDDRLIIRKIKNEFYVYNTPMYYPDESKKMRLNKLFLLRQEEQNILHQIHGAKAIANIFANCIHHNYDNILLNSLINLLTELINKAGVYELGFLPHTSVVEYILNNE